MTRTRGKRFKRDYSNKDLIDYLNSIYKELGRSPTSRDLQQFPGPAPRTIIRRFESWTKALKKANIRPQTHQILPKEGTFIRRNWKQMTDEQISHTLGISIHIIKYYRMNLDLWKNRKGTARATFRKKAFNIYGKNCESCNLSICEWHHIIPKSTDPQSWCILCPTCHAVITRKLISINSREEIKSKLKPFIKNLYQMINFGSDV